jgi:hypothetical protein
MRNHNQASRSAVKEQGRAHVLVVGTIVKFIWRHPVATVPTIMGVVSFGPCGHTSGKRLQNTLTFVVAENSNDVASAGSGRMHCLS